MSLLALTVSGAGGGQEGGDATQSRCSLALGSQTDIAIEDDSISFSSYSFVFLFLQEHSRFDMCETENLMLSNHCFVVTLT